MQLRRIGLHAYAFVTALDRTIRLTEDHPAVFTSRCHAITEARKLGIAVNREGHCYDLSLRF